MKKVISKTKTINGRKIRFDIYERYEVLDDQMYYDVKINRVLWCTCPDITQALITADLVRTQLHNIELLFV